MEVLSTQDSWLQQDGAFAHYGVPFPEYLTRFSNIQWPELSTVSKVLSSRNGLWSTELTMRLLCNRVHIILKSTAFKFDFGFLQYDLW
jgi:hypothetical protein